MTRLLTITCRACGAEYPFPEPAHTTITSTDLGVNDCPMCKPSEHEQRLLDNLRKQSLRAISVGQKKPFTIDPDELD